MKTKNLFIYGVVASALLITSCTKESENKDEFSAVPVEQHKTNIEDAGYQMLDEMKAMENEPAIQTDIALLNYMSMSSPLATGQTAKSSMVELNAFAPVIASANYSKTGMKGMVNSILLNPAADPSSIQEVFNQFVGIYEWNSAKQDWDIKATGDKIVLLFPSTETGTANNASYTVSYKGYTGPNPIEAQYSGDLPQSFSAKLVVDAVEISAYLFDAVYDAEGIPSLIETSFSMGQYKWSAKLSGSDNKKFDSELAFTKGSTILVKFVLGATGDWSQQNIEANTTYYINDKNTGEYVEVSKDDSFDKININIQKVVKAGNASFQAMNIKVAGNMDIEKMVAKIKEIDSTYIGTPQDEEAMKALSVAINEYVKVTLRYVDTDKVIAMVEAYPVLNTNTYQTYFNNGVYSETPVTVTETYYEIGLRFVFADGSKVDAETYLSETFSDFGNSLNEWATELKTNYGM